MRDIKKHRRKIIVAAERALRNFFMDPSIGREQHYGVVLLKDKEGKKIQSVIQRAGQRFDGVVDESVNVEERGYQRDTVYGDKDE